MPENGENHPNTRELYNRLALVFDFDQTLGPDSLAGFLDAHGVGKDALDAVADPLIDDGWDRIPARIEGLVRLGKRGAFGGPLTRDLLAKYAQEAEVFDGVPELFGRVRERVRAAGSDAEVEFHIVSAGIGDIIAEMPLAQEFTWINASFLSYEDDGTARGAKRVISHTEKTRYLLQIALGRRGNAATSGDFVPDLHSPIPEDELHVPFDQMIYVGDGSSDVPCFSLINHHRGVSLGVKQGAGGWDAAAQVHGNRRVDHLAPPSFGEGGELLEAILLGVDRIVAGVRLASMGRE